MKSSGAVGTARAVAGAMLVGWLVVNCGGGGGSNGGGRPPTTASVGLSVKGFTVGDPTIKCQGRIIWRLDPLTLTGSEGRSTTLTLDKSYSDITPSLEGSEWRCYFNEAFGATGLRVGTWRISAQLGTWAASCDEALAAGNNTIHFTQGRQGCVAGFAYP